MKSVSLAFLQWLRASAAGFMISGDSGTGKSQLMRLIMKTLALSGEGFFCIDPAGDEITWRARLATKVMHTAMILLAGWGERDFNSKPVLFKRTFRFLMLLGLAKLPISAVRYFFDPSHPVYQALSRFAPDFVTRMEMEDLADLRPKEREEIIASTKNRFLGWLTNPIVELLVSKRENVFDVRQLIQQRAIVIISLETGEGELHESDAEILANLWLSEIAFAIFNTPKHKRVWTTVFLDELPVFQSSFALLAKMAPMTRKLLCRWVCAFQGAFVFDQATENPLLNLIVGQCRTRFVFGHGNFKDCEFFAKVVKFHSIDLKRRKHTVRQKQQINVGQDLVTLYDEAVNWSDAVAEGGATADATTQTTTSTEQVGTTSTRSERPEEIGFRRAVSVSTGDRQGTSRADASGATTTATTNWSKTKSRGGSRTRRQTLVPKLKTEVIEHITFMTADEQFTEVAGKINGFDVGVCIIHRAGKGAAIVKLPLVRNRYFRTPNFARQRLQLFHDEVYSRPDYEPVQRLIEREQRFIQSLVKNLGRAAEQTCLPQGSRPLAIPARDDQALIEVSEAVVTPDGFPTDF